MDEPYELGMILAQLVEKDDIPNLITFLLLTLNSKKPPQLYDTLSSLLSNNKDKQIYLTFEDRIRPHLSFFFSQIEKIRNWSFFEFYMIIISISRPSLRVKISQLFWDCLITGKVTTDDICHFISEHDIFSHLFTNISLFVDILMTTPPSFISLSSTPRISNIILQVLKVYNEYCESFIEQILSYAMNGSKFSSSASLLTLISTDKTILSKTVLQIDDILTESAAVSIPCLQTICYIIARSCPIEVTSPLYISIQKRLLHHSQILIQAGISLAFNFARIYKSEVTEIMTWVFKSVNDNFLGLKPSILLSVVDMIYTLNLDEIFLEEIITFCLNLIHDLKVLVSVQWKKDYLMQRTKETIQQKYGIKLDTISTQQQGELVGELIMMIHKLKNKNPGNEKLNNNDVLSFMNDIKSIGFILPDKLFSENKHLSYAEMKQLMVIRSAIIPIVCTTKDDRINRQPFIDILFSINSFYKSPMNTTKRWFKDLHPEITQYSPSFVFHCIQTENFQFPRDTFFVSEIFNSLYDIFIDDLHEQRFFFDNRFTFVREDLEKEIPRKILEICENLINLTKDLDRSKDQYYIINYTQIVCNGLDFVTFCVISGRDFEIDYVNDIYPMINSSYDVGITSRLIVLGFQMNLDKRIVFNSINDIKLTNFVSDLMTHPIIYPYGIQNFEEIVNTKQPNSNWRFLLLLTLLTENFDEFYDKFYTYIDQIHDKLLPPYFAVTLSDILSFKMSLFPGRVASLSLLSFEILKLIFTDDLIIFETMTRLIDSLVAIQDTSEPSEQIGQVWAFLSGTLRSLKSSSFNGKKFRFLKRLNVACQQIKRPENATFQIVEESDGKNDDLFHFSSDSSSDSEFASDEEDKGDESSEDISEKSSYSSPPSD
ncbi:hypothetical protein TVAG_150390 [Trichomonas vaginalis G3]|uniref:Uncharacterized protein n=1 Tax=Trichomonas vaginalis (strain ATCC PRA-98 / G3) TaxID=412133 RepID=A2DRU1_TRIV3|nr:hypothetical protein TVAGG3_0978770 [Trichomonas vaginalis G3]EAY16888.1 hypothetical protein TVAG_150390 [Trichomonas vaginalis G3]KAI5489124.1 hypothetical protein TVAGG3_0978770 [Trichomonas vaginalis G3]|eukprot:XP_001329111.1 hypothetical protein [Trichomonas vaginalis G3]